MPPQQEDLPSPQGFALAAGIFEGGLAILAVVLGWLIGRTPLVTFTWSWADAGWGLVGILPPLALFWLCLRIPWRPLVELTGVVDSLLVPMFRGLKTIDLAAICFLAGLGEEMLFRGIVQQSITAWVGETAGASVGVPVGLGMAAILFGLVHRITAMYAVVAGLIGLYLGAIWLVTGNLLVPIMIHALYDFIVMLYLVHVRDPGTASPIPEQEGNTDRE